MRSKQNGAPNLAIPLIQPLLLVDQVFMHGVGMGLEVVLPTEHLAATINRAGEEHGLSGMLLAFVTLQVRNKPCFFASEDLAAFVTDEFADGG